MKENLKVKFASIILSCRTVEQVQTALNWMSNQRISQNDLSLLKFVAQAHLKDRGGKLLES